LISVRNFAPELFLEAARRGSRIEFLLRHFRPIFEEQTWAEEVIFRTTISIEFSVAEDDWMQSKPLSTRLNVGRWKAHLAALMGG
jgi:hypothetical protein